MKWFADAMASIGKPLSDDEVLGYMLAGLGSEFEPLVASITTRDEPVSSAVFMHSSLVLSSASSSKRHMARYILLPTLLHVVLMVTVVDMVNVLAKEDKVAKAVAAAGVAAATPVAASPT